MLNSSNVAPVSSDAGLQPVSESETPSKKSIRMLECEVAEQRRRKQQPAELTLRNLAQQYMFTLVFIYISGQLACSVMGARSKTGQSWRQRRGMQGCQGNWVCICMFTWIQLPLNDDHQNVSDNCVSFAP